MDRHLSSDSRQSPIQVQCAPTSGRKPNSRLLMVACLTLSAILVLQLAFESGRWQTKNRADPKEIIIEGLAVSKTALDMGEVWEAKDHQHTVPIRNLTSNKIEIDDFALSCGCVDIGPKPVIIQPGETSELHLTVDLTEQRRLNQLGVAQRQFAVQITPIQKKGAWPLERWNLHGLVKSRVTLDKFGVSFGEQPIKGENPPAQTVLATTHVPYRKLEPSFNSRILSVQVVPQRDQQNQVALIVPPNPSLPAGPFTSDLTLVVIGEAGERLPGVTIPVSGIMQNEIRLLPARVVLGSNPLGSKAEAHVVLQKPDNTKVSVEQIEIDSPDVDIELVSVEGLPSGRTYRVRQKITKLGDQLSQVRFIVRKENQQPMKVIMEVCYRGEVTEQEGQQDQKG
jgi:uncharacterized protein DUF1573